MGLTDVLLVLTPSAALSVWLARREAVKGKVGLMVGLLLMGAMSTMIALILEEGMDEPMKSLFTEGTLAYVLADNILCVGIAEEVSKFLAALGALRRKPSSLQESVVCFTMAHIGFSALENTLFVALGIASWGIRSFILFGGHILWGIIMGILYGKATLEGQNGNRPRALLLTMLALIVPVVMHGIYDALANQGNSTVFLLIIVGNIVAVMLLMAYAGKSTSAKDAEPEPVRQPEPTRSPEPVRQLEPTRQPEPVRSPEPVRQPRLRRVPSLPAMAPRLDRIFCPQCRTTMPTHAHFCPACGRQIMLRPSFA